MIAWLGNIVNAVGTTIAAMWVTLRYWAITYGARRRTFTEKFEYPEIPLVVEKRFRGFHQYDVHNCIACRACSRDCPADCIYIDRQKAEGRKGFQATGFIIDYTKCLMCGICVESCPTKCLTMGPSHDLSCYGRDGCIVDFCRLPDEIASGRLSLTPTAVAYSKLEIAEHFSQVKQNNDSISHTNLH